MASKYTRANLNEVKTYPLRERKNLVRVEDFASVVGKGSSFQEFLASFCHVGKRTNAATDLQAVVAAIVKAKAEKKKDSN